MDNDWMAGEWEDSMKYCPDCKRLVAVDVEESRDIDGKHWATTYCSRCGLSLVDVLVIKEAARSEL
jgi:hypothetical protein